MIKTKNGRVQMKGSECEVVADYMTVSLCIAEELISKKKGRESVKEEFAKIIDEVCKSMNSKPEE